MTDSTIDIDAIHSAYRLKDKNLPGKLYKFRGINDFSVSNFETDTVWICSADKFNDPYECATTWSTKEVMRQFARLNLEKIFGEANIEEHLSAEEIDTIRNSSDPLREIYRFLIGKHEDISEEQKEEIISVFAHIENDITQDMIDQMIQVIQSGMKICSFSSRVDSIIMWGHYADKHRGFAIEYDVTSWPTGDIRRKILHPMIYRQDLFNSTKYHLQGMTRRDFNFLFGTIAAIHKSPDWSYEHEWRFVIPMGKSLPDQNYLMPKPSAVYLGSRITSENKKRLSEIAAKKRIPIYQMGLSTSEFKLVPRDINVE